MVMTDNRNIPVENWLENFSLSSNFMESLINLNISLYKDKCNLSRDYFVHQRQKSSKQITTWKYKSHQVFHSVHHSEQFWSSPFMTPFDKIYSHLFASSFFHVWIADVLIESRRANMIYDDPVFSSIMSGGTSLESQPLLQDSLLISS